MVGDTVETLAEIGEPISSVSLNVEAHENEFYVGKLVWGKVRNNPWWPGQIYDPSDASDCARKLQKSGKLLVAYFGDGSFSWCSLSQLKPFAENFQKLSKQSTSTKLMHAVEEALNEIGRLVESKMSRSYISEESQSALARPLALNAGIKQGVFVPEYDLNEIPQLEPVEIISLLTNIATKASFSCTLELTVLKSWLSAFNRANGKNELAIFNEPRAIEVFGDTGRDGLVDVCDPVLDPGEGPSDEDYCTSLPAQREVGESNQSWLRKCEGIEEAGKLSKRRKRKSVSKLMKEVKIDGPNKEKGKMKNELRSGKRKRRSANDEEDISQSFGEITRNKGRRKSKTVKTLEEVLNAERGVNEDKETTAKDSVTFVSTFVKNKQRGNRTLTAKNGDGGRQLVSEKMNNESVAKKVVKITAGETENIATSRKKRINRTHDKDSEGKGADQARASPMTRKKKKKKKKKDENEKLDELTKESAKNGSKNKVNSFANDMREGVENVPAKDQESGAGKAGKITGGANENVAASEVKRTTRSSVKGSKEKSVDEAPNRRGEDLYTPSRKTARKRKKNEISDKITEKVENARNESTEKVASIGNEKREESENVQAKHKEPGTEKVDKITEGETDNVTACGEKRTTRSSVKGSKEKTVDEAPNRKEEDLSSPLQNMKRKKHKNDRLLSPEIAQNAESAKIVIGHENDNNNNVTENVRESRYRKKSMYLSPPFVDWYSMGVNLKLKSAEMGKRMTRVASEVIKSTPTFNSSNEHLHDKLSKEVGTSINPSPCSNPQPSNEEGIDIIDKRVHIVADQIHKSTPTLNSSNDLLLVNLSNEVVTENPPLDPSPRPSKEREREIIDSVQINISIQELVSEVRSAALNPLIIWDKNFLETVEGFISAYRNVNYLYGSYYNTFCNARQGEKQSLETDSELVKENDKDPGEETSKPVSLLVIFPPGFCLPTKTDLVATFSKFGPVNELETDVSHESYCAKVVFLSYSDTEKAFNTCLEKDPFGSAEVSYRLRYSAGFSQAKEVLKKPDAVWASTEFAGSCLLFIKQKLEIMTSIVDNCGGNMSNESMVKLEIEMKGLLDNVSTVSKSTSA